MPSNNTNIQRKGAFFHSLGKVLTKDTNLIGNELYKSSHNVRSIEIWMDEILFSPSVASASSISDDIVVTQVGDPSNPVYLFPLAQSNYQTWFMDSGTPSLTPDGFVPSDNWCKPLINPSDVPNEAGAPSFGFEFKMYRPSGPAIDYQSGYFEVDYFGGLVRFDVGRTPIDTTGSNGLNFQFSQSGFESIATTGNLVNAINYIKSTTTGGPRGLAWQYVGQTLDNFTSSDITGGIGITISGSTVSVSIDDETIKVNDDNELYVSGSSVYEVHSPNDTSGDNQPTGITISNTPLSYSSIIVSVNGQVQLVGGTSTYTTSDCYFRNSSGVVDIDDLKSGDEFYWNGSSGYDLASSDTILFMYNK